jgi:hypothetical protein
MDLSKLKPEYTAKVYQVSIKFPPFTFGSNQVIGYYETESLAHRVWKVFHNHFMKRIRGGVDVFSRFYFVEVIKISEEWHLINHPGKIIETEFNEKNIQACIDSLTQHAKEIKIKVIAGDKTERFESIFISHKRKTEEPLEKEPKERKLDHEAQLRELGFSFHDKKSLQKVYKQWALSNHPDKKTSDEERKAADIQFRAMRIHYDAVLDTLSD